MSKLEELEKKYQELGAEIEKLREEEKNKPWKPNFDETYYFTDDEGDVREDKWTNHSTDKARLAFGNVFQTQEDGRFDIEKRKVLAELKKFSSPFELRGCNWEILYHRDSETIIYKWTNCYQSACLYFKNIEMAKEAVKAVGADRVKKYYLGVVD